jgi:hypothetical protein
MSVTRPKRKRTEYTMSNMSCILADDDETTTVNFLTKNSDYYDLPKDNNWRLRSPKIAAIQESTSI